MSSIGGFIDCLLRKQRGRESQSPNDSLRGPARRQGPLEAETVVESGPSPRSELVAGSRQNRDIALRWTSADPQWIVVPPWSARRECTTRGAGRSPADFQLMDRENSSPSSLPEALRPRDHGYRQGRFRLDPLVVRDAEGV